MKFKIVNQYDQDFLSRENFDQSIARILKKAKERSSMLGPKHDFLDIHLKTLLANEGEFFQLILDFFAHEKIELSPFKKIEIITNKKREIFIASWCERILLMMAQNTLSRILEPHFSKTLYSFRKGLGPIKAKGDLGNFLKKCPDAYVIQLDISNYGPSINQSFLKERLENLNELRDSAFLKPVLIEAISILYQNANGVKSKLDQGIPSGSPLVPVVENFYLMPIDQLAQSQNIFYGRYGDDIILVSEDPAKLNSIFENIQKTLSTLELTLKSEKVKKRYLGKSPSKDLGFKSSHFFEWIGSSFNNQGEIGFKPQHRQEAKNRFHSDLNNLILKLRKNSINHSEAVLKVALSQYYHSNNPVLLKIYQSGNNISLIKHFHHDQRKFLTRLLAMHLKLTRREARQMGKRIFPQIKELLPKAAR
ncbi:MAG: reverse transcriptase domain-containing protein [Bacteriovoracaceae bacterium]